ncbi:MAG TPA: phosphatidylglycerophosphatase A [Nitrospirota bacterium]|nr:phosphatidylglycerophosphatase A [Nitrospirota bacterium]
MEMQKTKHAVVLFVAQGAYAGKLPFAPGTAGTLVGVFLYLLVNMLPLAWYLFISVLVVSIGIWAAGEAEKLLHQKDAPSIVIDEIAGYLISMAMVPRTWGSVIAGFAIFRFFDIWKPWPLRKIQDIHGGTGIMLDDIGAGIYTNILLQILSRL